MSLLRKKYFSLQTQSFIDVPTDVNNNFNSSDILSVYNNETVRLIQFNSEINSGKMDDLISDLIYNDKILLDNFQKLNSLISNGTFYSIGDNFSIYNVEKIDLSDGTYIKSFGIKSGQIKYNDEIIFLEPAQTYKLISSNSSGNTSYININNTDNLTTGSVIFGSEFQSGTTVESINGTQITLSKNLYKDIFTNSLILFMDIPIFRVGHEIEEISSSGSYPIWRRDLISYDIKNSNWEVLKGTENLNIPPINTQLDAMYQIESIIYISNDKHKIKLTKNNRDLLTDFIIGDYTKVYLSNNKTFDGEYEITEIDQTNNSITVRIPLFRDNSKNQIESGGYLDLKKIAIISILVYKASESSQSLIFDEIEKVSQNSGITGGIQNIIQAQIEPDGNYYYIKSNDFIHLRDIEGRLLDWEEAQGYNVSPELGYIYNKDQGYDEFQIPFPDYAGMETGYLTNIPFNLQEVDNNIFGLKTVDVVNLKIGIKNSPISIGQEGIQYRITAYETLSDELSVYNSNSSKLNGIITKTTINNPSVDFTTLGINLTRKDFILVSDGKGSFQTGMISNFGTNYLEILNLSKELNYTSKFIIFRNMPEIITNSETYITNDMVRSQVLSGINGVFGEDNVYSKVELAFGNISPKVNLKKWYFLNLKNYSLDNYEQGSPYIVIENIKNSEIFTSSAIVEVYYRTITGKYPDGNLLIEDEFGDIYTEYRGRLESPHFRPSKYQVIAKSLDKDINYPQNQDEVFVDPHVGKIKFHPLAKPRKVFVSYNKLDVIDGDSTDFSIKHIDVESGLKTNVQDKISEIDSRFNNQTEIKKTWLVNGLISKEDSGFCGPFNIDEQNSYNIIYKDYTFENFTFDEDNYVVKLSNHQYDNPVYIGEHNVILDNISLENINPEVNFVSNELISDFDFLDYELGVSGNTLPQVGYNFYHEYFVPIADSFVNDSFVFYKKKKIFENPDVKSNMYIDNGLFSPDFGIQGNWNYLYSSYFNKNNVLYGLLRKSNYEELLINANPNLKRRLRQREFIKLLDNNFNDINDQKSETQIISEKFLSKSILLDNIKYKENYLQLKAEITKYKDYQFLTAQDIDGQSLGLYSEHGISQSAFSISPLTFKKTSKFINNYLITAYIDQTNLSYPKYTLINFSKTKEINDIDTVSNRSENILLNINESAYEIKSCVFNENYIAIAYVNQIGINFYIKIRIYSIENNLLVYQTGSEQKVGTLVADYHFNISQIGTNKIAIVWKKSESEIASTIYTYSTASKISSINKIRIIENQYSLIDSPSITYFGKDNFIVAYSNLLGAKVKIFDLDGNLLFFDNNDLIDYRTLTLNNIPITGNFIKILELNNNDIAIVFLDKELISSEVKYTLKLVILDSWTKNWKYPLNSENTSKSLSMPIIIESSLTSPINSLSICLLNEDVFCVSYIKDTKINLKAFKNDGGQLFNSLENLNLYNYSIVANRVGDSSIILTHIVTNPLPKAYFSVYNFRPDFTKDSRTNTSFQLGNYVSQNIFKLFNFEKNNFISVIQSSSNLEIKIISTDNKDIHYQNPNYSPLTISLTSLSKILNIKYVSFYLNDKKINVLLILWTNNIQIYLKFIKILNNQIIDAGDLSITTNISSYTKNFGNIIQLKDHIIGIILRNSTTNKYNIHGVDLKVFENENTFGTPSAYNYTTDSSNIFNPSLNVLSGVNFDNDISFYQKDDTNYFLFYPSLNDTSSGTIISNIVTNNVYYSNQQLTLSNLSANNRTVLNSDNQYLEINFVENSINSNQLFVVGNSTGTGYFHRIDFDSNNNILPISTGILNVTSGTITSELNIFNSSEDNNLILIYNETISGNNYRISFLNKNNFVITPSKPVDLFPEPNRDIILKSTKSNSSDIYLMFVSNGKIVSKTYSSFFNDNFEDEKIYFETDYLGVTRNRFFNDQSLKINGINWRGIKLKQFPAFSIPSLNIDSTQIDSDGMFRSDFFNISAHLVSISKDSFSVVFHYHKDKSSEISIKLRNYVISRNRIFADSDWIIGSNEFSFEGNTDRIYLRAIQHTNENIFYIWSDLKNKVIKKAIVNKYNQSLAGTYEDVIESNGSSWVLIRGDRLVEGWIVVLIYNLDTNKFYTNLYNPEGKLQRFGSPFSLPFNYTTTLTSQVTINEFGYFMWLYMDENQNLRYYQHGFDGDPWGIAQITGKNYLGHLESTSNSPIENNLFNSPDFKFVKYNRIDMVLTNSQIISITDIYKTQETGFYRILCLDNPLINITFGLIGSIDQEPIVSIDTNSSYVSSVSGTNNKFNIYIDINSILNFENKLGKTLRFRFYKEN